MLPTFLKIIVRRKYFIQLLLACFLISIGSNHISALSTETEPIEKDVSLENSMVFHERDSNSNPNRANHDLYVPAIGLVKEGVLNPGGVGIQPCTIIDYTYYVTNESTAGELLEFVSLEDPLISPNPVSLTNNSGDLDNDNLLDPNEVWVFTATYAITPAERIAGEVVASQARISASPEGGGQFVSDTSDANGPVITDISTCQPRISLIKTGNLDPGGFALCTTIEYIFTVTNESLVDELDNVALNDPLLASGSITGPIVDIGGDGKMSIGEVWEYSANYTITQDDLNNGEVQNQAEVNAIISSIGEGITDFSHPIDPQNDGDTITDISSCQNPTLGLVLVGMPDDTDTDGCNDIIIYSYAVTNIGNVDLEEINISDNLLNIITLENPNLGDVNNNNILEIGETWNYSASYDITQNDIDNSPLDNQASVSAEIIGSNTATSDFSHPTDNILDGQTSINVAAACDAIDASIALILQNDSVDTDADGCDDTVNYTYLVRNTGSVELDQVSLDDNLFNIISAPSPNTGDSDNDNILDPNEEWEYSATYNITQNDIDNSPLANQAHVSAQTVNTDVLFSDDSDDDNYAQNDPTVIDVSGACDNTVAISVIRGAQLIDTDLDGCNDQIDFTITVNNPGNADLDTVVLNDDQLGNALAPSSNGNGDNVLDAGEQWIYTGSYDITQFDIDNSPLAGEASVTAEHVGSSFQVSDLSHPTDPTDDLQNSIDVSAACSSLSTPSIGLIKQALTLFDGDGCEDTIEYIYYVRNLGNVDLININLDDTMLANVGLIVDSEDIANDGILQSGETWIYQPFNYTVTQADIDSGIVQTQATVFAEHSGNGTQISDISDNNSFVENDFTITSVVGACIDNSAAIGLIKEANMIDLDNDGCPDTILYTFTVGNLGGIALENILLEDDFFNGPIAGPNSGDDNTNGILDAAEQWKYLVIYDITQADIAMGEVLNQATVSAYRSDRPNISLTDFSDDDDFTENEPTITSVVGACANIMPSIGLVKRGFLFDVNGDECPDGISFTYTVANLGNTALTNIILRDELFENPIEGFNSGDNNANGILDPGEEWIFIALYGLTQTDINEEEVESQATVTATVMNQADINVNDLSDNDNFIEDDPTTISVEGACSNNTIDPNFKIFTGITPNGDGINDFFRIRGIESFPDNSLKIYNRWGVLVYEADQYGEGNNLFSGTSFGRATVAEDRELPTGTYFYILTFSSDNPGKENYSGYLYINRD